MSLGNRRRMLGAAKGAEEGMFKKLETITLTTSENAVDFDLTQYPDIPFFVVRMNTEFSTSDWIYLRINENKVEVYTYKQKLFTNAEIAIFRSGVAPAWVVGMTAKTDNYRSSTRPNKVGFVPYGANTTFGAGSTFELFGAKLP